MVTSGACAHVCIMTIDIFFRPTRTLKCNIIPFIYEVFDSENLFYTSVKHQLGHVAFDIITLLSTNPEEGNNTGNLLLINIDGRNTKIGFKGSTWDKTNKRSNFLHPLLQGKRWQRRQLRLSIGQMKHLTRPVFPLQPFAEWYNHLRTESPNVTDNRWLYPWTHFTGTCRFHVMICHVLFTATTW